MQGNRFISPGCWFSMEYPKNWNEFDGGDSAFLFYNPDVWEGNFRLSAYKGDRNYASKLIQEELAYNKSAKRVRVGDIDAVYSSKNFDDEEYNYTTHFWIFGSEDMTFECSYTFFRDSSITPAFNIIKSIAVRDDNVKYDAELIPIRLSEIYLIDSSYEWVVSFVKEQLKKDFQGHESDLPLLQEILDKGLIGKKKRDEYLALGIAICVIITNEYEEFEWKTLIDGNRECPVLIHGETVIDPLKLVWSYIKANQPCNIIEIYKELW